MNKQWLRGILSALVAALGLLSANTSYAHKALSDSMNAELHKISAIMYAQGNLNYIDADALCDGLITAGAPYSITYHKNGTLTINDSRIPGSLKRTYNKKLHAFLQEHRFGAFSTKSDGLKLADVFNSASTFRSRHDDVRNMAMVTNNKDPQTIDTLVAMLSADRLIDPLKGYHVKLSPDGIYADGQKLDDQRTKQYLQKLAMVDPSITTEHIPFLEVTFKLGPEKK